MKLKTTLKIFCLLLIAVFILFTACKDPADDVFKPDPNGVGSGDDDEYHNPNAGLSRVFTFSHESGLYASGFSLTITAAPGSTIYYTTDGSEPVPGRSSTRTYTAPISVINRTSPVQPNVLATQANIDQMYIAPNDPRGSTPGMHTVSNDVVPKATVIRAMAVDGRGNRTDVVTKTYFVGTNAQLFGSQNVRVISLVSDPIGLVSEATGIMVRGGDDKRWDGPLYNFQQRGEEWERVASFELFEGNSARRLLLDTNVSIRVRGGWSRDAGQKSFNVYFRQPSDLFRINAPTGSNNTFDSINNLKNFVLIPGANKVNGTPVDTVKSFMLRTGGNDRETTKFVDVFIHELLRDRKFTTQAAVPVILYLNGEYWGVTNMQERYSDNFLEYKYGVNRDLIISIDNGALDDGNPGEDQEYWDVVEGYTNSNITYEEFCNRIDIDNFIDYWAAQIYIYNEDWPHNNYIVWKTRNPTSGTYGDTKWRYSLHDSEFSLGIYSNGSTTGQTSYEYPSGFGDAFNKIINGGNKGHEHNRLFIKLLDNEDFCKKFANVMLELYNVNFHPDNYEPILTRYINQYEPLIKPDDWSAIPSQFTRWGGWGWSERIPAIRNYLGTSGIRSKIPGYLTTYLGIPAGNLKNITFSTTLPGSTSINVYDSFTPPASSGSWTGLFNTTGGIKVTASPPPAGYLFDGWIVSGGTPATSSDSTITVSVTAASATITAVYKQQGITYFNPTNITLSNPPANLKPGDVFTLTPTILPADTPTQITYKTLSWSSSNTNVMEVDGNGKVTVKGGGTVTITATSTMDTNIKGTKEISAIAVFMAELHAEGIKLIIDKNLVNDKYQDVTIRLSGWGDNARVSVNLGGYSNNAKVEIIYPFTQNGRTYSFDVEIDGVRHTVTETAGSGGVGELIINNGISYNSSTETINVSATLNNLNDSNTKLNRSNGGWRIVLRNGSNWDNSYGWYEIANYNTGGSLGYEYSINKSIPIEDLKDFYEYYWDSGSNSYQQGSSYYDLLEGGNVFALLYYDAYYDDIRFDSQERDTTFRFPEPNLPGEILINELSAYNDHPEHLGFTSSVDYKIVDLPNDGRTNVMKVSYPDGWATAIYDLNDYKGQRISISFSLDVKREGEAGNVTWQINNNNSSPSEGHPAWPVVVSEMVGSTWETLSGSITITPTGNTSDSSPVAQLYITNWDNATSTNIANINSIFYIDNFWIEIIPAP